MNERPYASVDLPRIIAIYGAAIRTLAAPYYAPEQIAAWAPATPDAARWQERMARLHTVVVEENGVIVGFASYTRAGYLDFLFTHPAAARRGVASRLYRCVESASRAAGAARVTTHASLAARAFFDRQGFRIDAEERVECRGVFLRRFAMHKPLGGTPSRRGALARPPGGVLAPRRRPLILPDDRRAFPARRGRRAGGTLRML